MTAKVRALAGWDYRAAVGRSRHDLPTPALVLDLDVAKRNIAEMAARMRDLPARLRPHAKLHKSPRIGRLQLEAGAIGLTVATVWEAAMMVRAGIDDVLIANQVVGEDKIRALAETAREGRLTLAVDDARNADDLSAAALAVGSTLGVLIEIDVGQGRSGVRTGEEARRLAQHISRLRGLRLEGMMGYEGHCSLEPDRAERVRKAHAATAELLAAVDLLARHRLVSRVVSAGGTGTYDITGANPRVTEIQAGSYVFMDAFHGSLVPGFAIALTVLATVVSRQGRTVVLDTGWKTVGANLMLPRVDGLGVATRSIAEEHLLLDAEPDCPLQVGDRVEVVPGYAPTTVNLHDVYYVVKGDVVTDVWPVLARGAGRGPLAG